MTERRACLILNRKHATRPPVEDAVRALRSSGFDVSVRIPWDQAAVPSVLDEAVRAGATRIIAGGGDGTINGLVNAMLTAEWPTDPCPELGVLPLGTANDFAKTLELPVMDLTACLRRACEAEARAVDVGKANDRYFINVASGGFGAQVTATTPPQVKKVLGGAAYALTGLATAMGLQPYRGSISVDGGDPVEGEMLLMAVGNARYAGGGFTVAPHASIEDGLLDVAILAHDEDFSVLRLASEFGAFEEGEGRYLYARQMETCTLEFDQTVHFNLDGEPYPVRRVDFSVLPGRLKLAWGSR